MLAKHVLLIILSTIVVKIIAINLFNNPDRADIHNISKPLIRILQGYFQNDLNPLIITEQSSKYVFSNSNQTLLSSSSIILINNKFKIQQDVRNYNPHIGTFLLTASTEDHLNRTISQLQSTPWWNTESYFLLIGPSTYSSVNASKMLAIMWKRKILSVVYLCYDIDKEAVMLYTFNPFNNYAPSPWKWVNKIEEKPDPRWNLYEHQYQGDGTICPVIMFDKTLKLDDYVISVIMDKKARQKEVPTGIPIRLNDYIQYILSKRITVTMNDVFSHMNVKLNLTDSDHLKCCLQTNDERLLTKLEDLLGNALLLRPQPMYLGYKHVTYPDARVLMILVGQKRPFLNTETKILSFFHVSILAPIAIVFIMSAVVLKINRRQHLTSALLKIWQLFLSSYFPQALNNTQTRIFFFGVFWLVIILNGTFQGKLASFLTVDYMTGTGYLELPADKQKYLHLVETDRCLDPVLNDPQALCLTNPNYGTTNAKKYGLHISSPVLIFYTSYWVSPGFPLVDIYFVLSNFKNYIFSGLH